jgi:hypothetical protein
MTFLPPTYEDLLKSATSQGMPSESSFAQAETRNYFQAIDNLIRVFAIRPTDDVLFLTDPLLDRRVIDAISGIALSRGVQPREFMGPTSQIGACPPELRPLIEKATFVISSWFSATTVSAGSR